MKKIYGRLSNMRRVPAFKKIQELNSKLINIDVKVIRSKKAIHIKPIKLSYRNKNFAKETYDFIYRIVTYAEKNNLQYIKANNRLFEIKDLKLETIAKDFIITLFDTYIKNN